MTEVNEEQGSEKHQSVHGSTAASEHGGDTERGSNVAEEEASDVNEAGEEEARLLARELEKIKVKMPTMTV